MKMRKGDLSAPVLAIIVTIGVIAAGLVLMSWFWWFAPTIGRTGMLMVVGQPVLVNATNSEKTYNLTIVLKNVGNTDIKIEGIVVKNAQCVIRNSNVIGPGKTVVMRNIQCRNVDIPRDEYFVEGILITDAGTYRFSANII